jgi:hypothetical protein
MTPSTLIKVVQIKAVQIKAVQKYQPPRQQTV